MTITYSPMADLQCRTLDTIAQQRIQTLAEHLANGDTREFRQLAGKHWKSSPIYVADVTRDWRVLATSTTQGEVLIIQVIHRNDLRESG